jgi:hypothetical protein
MIETPEGGRQNSVQGFTRSQHLHEQQIPRSARRTEAMLVIWSESAAGIGCFCHE